MARTLLYELHVSAHINNTYQAVIYHLYNIKRISRYLSYDDRKSIVQAVIMSRVDYCNSLLVGVPAIQLCKLQRLQNAAAHFVRACLHGGGGLPVGEVINPLRWGSAIMSKSNHAFNPWTTSDFI